MNNKYQQAIELLKEDHISNELNTVDKINHNARLGNIIDLLQELVDKATPKKPIKIKHKYGGMEDGCPYCNSFSIRTEELADEQSYCPDCGQALDWSKNE